VVKTIVTEDSHDLLAAAVPSRMDRWRAEGQLFELEQRRAAAERRAIEQRHQQRAAAASDELEKLEKLRADVVELGKACNQAMTAVLDNLDAMSTEIAELRTRVSAVEQRKRATKAKRSDLPAFLPARLS
jgi:hypothetical protein